MRKRSRSKSRGRSRSKSRSKSVKMRMKKFSEKEQHRIARIRDWYLNDSNYLLFLRRYLTAKVCGADYPYYCGGSSKILAIYFQKRFGLRAIVVGGWPKWDVKKETGHNYLRVIDKNGTAYDVDATSYQFTKKHALLWEPAGTSYIYDRKNFAQTEDLEKEAAIVFDRNWERYLNNVLAHTELFI